MSFENFTAAMLNSNRNCHTHWTNSKHELHCMVIYKDYGFDVNYVM